MSYVYNVWAKLKTLTLDDSQKTKDSEDVSKLKANTVDKNHEDKHLKNSSKSKVLTVDDSKDMKKSVIPSIMPQLNLTMKRLEKLSNKLLFFQTTLSARRH